MTLPNIITVFRFLLALLFAGAMIQFRHEGNSLFRYLALGLFVLAALSDFADGYIARKYHLTSRWGAVMDPLADKILTLIVLFFLIWVPDLHDKLYPALLWTFTSLVLWREVVILGGIGVLRLLRKKIEISPIKSGKWCTAIQFITLALLIWGVGKWGNLLILLSSFFLLISGAGYVRQGIRYLQTRSRNSPVPEGTRETPGGEDFRK